MVRKAEATEVVAAEVVLEVVAAAEEEEDSEEEEEFSHAVADAVVASAETETSSVTSATGWDISPGTAVKRWTAVTSVTKWDTLQKIALTTKSMQEVVTTAESKGIVKLIAPTERRGDATNAASQDI